MLTSVMHECLNDLGLEYLNQLNHCNHVSNISVQQCGEVPPQQYLMKRV